MNKYYCVFIGYIKGMLFVCFIWGKAAVPAAVSTMLNAMQSLDVAVCLWTNQIVALVCIRTITLQNKAKS